ncbi:MAG: hypothetical protein EBU93_05460 [Chlamydiae bacterium]|nr:hypothetical protein [Chlamydiota bacterium]
MIFFRSIYRYMSKPRIRFGDDEFELPKHLQPKKKPILKNTVKQEEKSLSLPQQKLIYEATHRPAAVPVSLDTTKEFSKIFERIMSFQTSFEIDDMLNIFTFLKGCQELKKTAKASYQVIREEDLEEMCSQAGLAEIPKNFVIFVFQLYDRYQASMLYQSGTSIKINMIYNLKNVEISTIKKDFSTMKI